MSHEKDRRSGVLRDSSLFTLTLFLLATVVPVSICYSDSKDVDSAKVWLDPIVGKCISLTGPDVGGRRSFVLWRHTYGRRDVASAGKRTLGPSEDARLLEVWEGPTRSGGKHVLRCSVAYPLVYERELDVRNNVSGKPEIRIVDTFDPDRFETICWHPRLNELWLFVCLNIHHRFKSNLKIQAYRISVDRAIKSAHEMGKARDILWKDWPKFAKPDAEFDIKSPGELIVKFVSAIPCETRGFILGLSCKKIEWIRFQPEAREGNRWSRERFAK